MYGGVWWLVGLRDTFLLSAAEKSAARISPGSSAAPSFLYGSQLEPRHVSGTWARSIRAPLASLAHQLTHSQRNCFAKDEWARERASTGSQGERFLPDNPSLPSATKNIMQAKINERGRNYTHAVEAEKCQDSSLYPQSDEIDHQAYKNLVSFSNK